MGAGPGLLGCGQENEQVDDAVLQGVEVLRGKGGDVWAGLDGHFPGSPLPLPPRDAKGSEQRCSAHTHGGLCFTSSADESRLPTKGVRGRFPGVSHVPAVSAPPLFSTIMFQHSKPDAGSFALKNRKRVPLGSQGKQWPRSEGWGLLGTQNQAGCPS